MNALKFDQRRINTLWQITVPRRLTGMAVLTAIVFLSIGPAQGEPVVMDHDRSPVDLALSASGKWLVTANQTSHSISLISVPEGRLVDEQPCGEHPTAVAFADDGQTVVVSSMWSGEVSLFQIAKARLEPTVVIPVGFQPCGIAIDQKRRRAFVALVAAGQVAEIDLANPRLIRRIDVGQWPRYLTLSGDGKRLAVGCSGDSKIVVVDTSSGKSLYEATLANGINFGHMQTSVDGKYAYFTWMVYRTNPITVGNIRRGWVLASRIGRIRLDQDAYREAISLDVPGQAIGDPHGLVISDDQQHLVASASGTHELLVYRLPDLPMVGTGGPGDLIDRRLARDRDRFDRIDLGGRPMGLAIDRDHRTVYVANFLRNSVQVVDIDQRQVIDEISLGGTSEPTTLARKGMALFYDATRSLDQWYSCHSCHQNGGTNSRPMDTMNDGTELTFKTVLPLFDVHETAPWTWHGWQESLTESIETSFTTTMIGDPPTPPETQAVLAYLKTLERPPNPYRQVDGSLSAAAVRGQQVFESAKAGCIDCHHGPHFTDGLIHDVGLGSAEDYYQGFNTPSLNGLYQKVQWLHSGRARTLERVINDLHSPQKVSGGDELTPQETADLIEYLRSL